MNSVTFSTKPRWQWILALIWLPILGPNVMVLHYSIEDLRSAFASSGDLSDALIGLKVAMVVLAVASILFVPVLVIDGYRRNAPERNFLQLDRDSLTYVRGGKSRHWPWSVLPAFKTILSYRQVRFVLPEGDAKPKRRDPWIHEVTPDGPVVAIRDIYDAPLEEIAARLNEYRDHALGAGGPEST